MTDIIFKYIAKSDLESIRWLRWLDAEIFPSDTPSVVGTANWFLGWDKDHAVAFCGWKPYFLNFDLVGFHYRAGVLPDYRGQGLQKKMVEKREDEMRRSNIKIAVTYTEVYSAASMTTFINMGYRPYEATETTALCDLSKFRRMVHWRKNLND
jgi:GNAT superfamily N-acetyltransferase